MSAELGLGGMGVCIVGVFVDGVPKKPGLVGADEVVSSLISDGPAGDGGVLGDVAAAVAAAAAPGCCAALAPGGIRSGRRFAAENA